uniref:CRAL-TRIO domain-containing protein n=1 Tax=Helicotheca tamesis TaxID=374047 RepID=A0A7S2GX91_9STRA|mmetsp:Transcript_13018/g.17915  ORF Transcript_13018/g.17915 Transcript_13018/m.17915 type:complete len:346 (+) Transcript_13018:127-1164(+)|eukprot:CAMPEP_0185729442 /NCGR_PEP_ID=MMETSP1171-20130828/5740_1 /TAXON_ID=374046 /ORGANISM="Helicotheca tamensis, Strain CCMP826" /LENGTH=345 /DNA_ID=CAMNT_0028398281 /DNA_START=60 /DNA_END=1097 /DNA_ORIENTATION=+
MSSADAKLEDAKLLSASEAERAKAEIAEGAEDEFEDAVESDQSSGFEVTAEEMSIIRAELACEFPDDYKYLSDAYIRSVASKPYSKDPSIRRPLEYTMEKLSHVMEWREQAGAPEMEDLVKLGNGPENAPEAVESPEKLAKAKALVASLNTGSLYWHGLTKDGRPVLWVRTNRKPWYPDVEADINALIVLADAGIRAMPANVTDFVCVSDSASPPPPNPSFMIGMLKALVKGYPDRLNLLVSAPVSSIIQFVMKLLLPLMPGRLASKVILLDVPEANKKLEDLLLNGKDDIPTFFDGPSDHDKFYPEESRCPNRGKGTLKFDYFGMMERLEDTVKEFNAMSTNGS